MVPGGLLGNSETADLTQRIQTDTLPARHPKARFSLHSRKIIRKDDDIRARYTAL